MSQDISGAHHWRSVMRRAPCSIGSLPPTPAPWLQDLAGRDLSRTVRDVWPGSRTWRAAGIDSWEARAPRVMVPGHCGAPAVGTGQLPGPPAPPWLWLRWALFWRASLPQEQCCVLLLPQYLVLSGCLILQDPLVPGPWAWMTRLTSRTMQLMRSWTASSSPPPKCPASEWCRGRGSAPAPTGSLVSAWESGCGTRAPGSSLLALYDPGGRGLRGGVSWTVPGARRAHLWSSTKGFCAGASALAIEEGGVLQPPARRGCRVCSGLPWFTRCPREGLKGLSMTLVCRGGYSGPVAKYCPECFAEAIFLPLAQHQGGTFWAGDYSPVVHCCPWTCWRWAQRWQVILQSLPPLLLLRRFSRVRLCATP